MWQICERWSCLELGRFEKDTGLEEKSAVCIKIIFDLHGKKKTANIHRISGIFYRETLQWIASKFFRVIITCFSYVMQFFLHNLMIFTLRQCNRLNLRKTLFSDFYWVTMSQNLMCTFEKFTNAIGKGCKCFHHILVQIQSQIIHRYPCQLFRWLKTRVYTEKIYSWRITEIVRKLRIWEKFGRFYRTLH